MIIYFVSFVESTTPHVQTCADDQADDDVVQYHLVDTVFEKLVVVQYDD